MSLDSDDCLGDDLTNPRRVVAMSRGIVGLFTSIDYPCMTGLIEKTTGLTVYEPDEGVVHFARLRPLDQNAVSRSAVLAPAREDDGTGWRGSHQHDRAF